MSPQRRPSIVVGLDGSPDGLLALEWSVDLASHRNWQIRGIHVIDPGRPVPAAGAAEGPDDGTEVLDEAADELERLGFADAALEIRHGHPAEVLLGASGDAPMLVTGRRGLGGFAELTAGSTSQMCAALARSSLVVVPDSWRPAETEQGLVVVGVDGSHSCQAALGFAFEFAAERRAELILVHVADAPEEFPRPDLWLDPDDAPWHQDARTLIAQAVAGWPEKYPDVVFRTHYRPGHPVQVLAQQSKYADLLVVGGLGRSQFTPLRLGSVSRGVLHHSHCPVAIIHGEVERR